MRGANLYDKSYKLAGITLFFTFLYEKSYKCHDRSGQLHNVRHGLWQIAICELRSISCDASISNKVTFA